MKQRSPRFRTRDGAPGRMCKCGHREGSHNDLSRCCAGECSCGAFPHAPRELWGGFDPMPEGAPRPKSDPRLVHEPQGATPGSAS